LVRKVKDRKEHSRSLAETRAQRDNKIINRLGFLFVAYRVEFWFELPCEFPCSPLNSLRSAHYLLTSGLSVLVYHQVVGANRDDTQISDDIFARFRASWISGAARSRGHGKMLKSFAMDIMILINVLSYSKMLGICC
jgi:hypothetical protein